MIVLGYIFKGLAIFSNLLFFAGIYYGKIIYNKKFRAKRVHYLTVGVAVGMIVYLIILIYYIAGFILVKDFIKSAVCLLFLTSPFLIGVYGNNYDKAKTYFNIQLGLLALSLLFLVFFV